MADDDRVEFVGDYIGTDRDALTDLKRFVREVCDRTGLDWEQAESTAIGVLCVLDQRLSGGEGRKLAAALPAPIYSLIERCHWDPNAKAESFGFDEFLDRTADHLKAERDDALQLVRAVFAAARNSMPFAERDNIESQLPVGGLKELWRSPEPADLPDLSTLH